MKDMNKYFLEIATPSSSHFNLTHVDPPHSPIPLPHSILISCLTPPFHISKQHHHRAIFQNSMQPPLSIPHHLREHLSKALTFSQYLENTKRGD
eukprot:TRINITY_DN5992_c0_g1_i2.p1 TRINITY_DN5992_c0_g1~~TRINITY_DN5992_c0_g1_i2.p1  ORF type:complete len:105 (+),score=28.74 TRINITY_DN5992_c0_g1_i2:35-316(+)